MRSPSYRTHRSDVEARMTPMIDVVFLLLIFFVCTASFQIAEQILPAGLTSPAGRSTIDPSEVEPDLEQLVVTLHRVDDQLQWTLNEQPYSRIQPLYERLSAIAGIDATLPVILDIGGTVAMLDVIQLYDVCQLAGLQRIHFAASAAL